MDTGTQLHLTLLRAADWLDVTPLTQILASTRARSLLI
jgi:hypothetical protein